MACAERALADDLLKWKLRLQDLSNANQMAREGRPVDYAWGNDYLCILNDLIADELEVVNVLQVEDIFISLTQDEGIHAHRRLLAILCQQVIFLQFPLAALHAAEKAGVLVHQGRKYVSSPQWLLVLTSSQLESTVAEFSKSMAFSVNTKLCPMLILITEHHLCLNLSKYSRET
jgi:hypothetical protein